MLIQAKIGIGESNDFHTPYHNCQLSKQSGFQTGNKTSQNECFK